VRATATSRGSWAVTTRRITGPIGGYGSGMNANETPRTWRGAFEQTQAFQALLKRYQGDFPRATDAWVRGERGDPSEVHDTPNPMYRFRAARIAACAAVRNRAALIGDPHLLVPPGSGSAMMPESRQLCFGGSSTDDQTQVFAPARRDGFHGETARIPGTVLGPSVGIGVGRGRTGPATRRSEASTPVRSIPQPRRATR
jgi:hypothetical protein